VTPTAVDNLKREMGHIQGVFSGVQFISIIDSSGNLMFTFSLFFI